MCHRCGGGGRDDDADPPVGPDDADDDDKRRPRTPRPAFDFSTFFFLSVDRKS